MAKRDPQLLVAVAGLLLVTFVLMATAYWDEASRKTEWLMQALDHGDKARAEALAWHIAAAIGFFRLVSLLIVFTVLAGAIPLVADARWCTRISAAILWLLALAIFSFAIYLAWGKFIPVLPHQVPAIPAFIARTLGAHELRVIEAMIGSP